MSFEPIQTATGPEITGTGNGLTVTLTELLFEQPVKIIFSVKLYSVDTDGFTVGVEESETKPAGVETQLYELPVFATAPN